MFVDFDNVYIGLHRLDQDAAKSFAEDPGRWVDALASGTDADGPFARKFLVRKCYLNPSSFSRFRPNFTRAGFQVVDCPSLTQQGKSSADINLVLDAVDALSAPTHFDEFVFLSADADFTPLIARCRAADRQVTIVTPGPAAAAYRAVADTVVAVDSFIEILAEGVRDETTLPLAASKPVVSQVMPVVNRPRAAANPAVDAVRSFILAAESPVILGVAAGIARQADPSLPGSAWSGAGSFSDWLTQFLPELARDSRVPGHVWDPKRFSESDLVFTGAQAPSDSDLSELQRQVVTITEVPALDTGDYRRLLEQLAFDLALFSFNRTETSKRVRDECQKSDKAIARSAINFVINGLLLAGANLREEPSAPELAGIWAENVLGLCRGARIELSDADRDDIFDWVGGHLAERPSF